jgi:hypothetical protein
MKWIGPLLLLILLVAAPAASQAPDDKLIVPGQRFGKWTLQMTLADLVQMNGSPRVIRDDGQDRTHQGWIHSWNRLGVFAVTGGRDAQQIEVLGTDEDEYKTDKGIVVLATRDAAERAYGRPTAVTQRGVTGQVRLIWDEIGLFVLIAGDVVSTVGIFRPGTAKSIWKF